MGKERSMKMVSALLGLPLVATILVSLVQGTRHLAWDWPIHAHHHLIAHISASVGLAVVGLLILVGPMRQGERWAWWGLLVAGVAIYGGFWTGNAMVGLGEPSALPNTAQAIQTAMYLAGLALGWRAVRTTEPVPEAMPEGTRG